MTSIISVGVVPMLVVLVVGFFAVRSIIWQTVREDLENRALNLANSIESELKYQISYCTRSANRSRLRSFLHTDATSLSPETVTQYKEYLDSWKERVYDYGLLELSVLDKDGHQIVPATDDNTVDYTGEPWWNRASQAGRTVVVEFTPDAAANKIYTRILAPIKNSAGDKIIGYIHLRVDMNAVEGIRNARPNQADDAFLVMENMGKYIGVDLHEPGKTISVSSFEKELPKKTKKKGFGSMLIRWPHEGAYL
ncbi:MAG: cache domain-containing protein, partial [Candidatus Hydrogenedentes bacterium]|nr:cache domain-containing protein [Candidatus Hydrogenedentota bacterium]